MNELTQFFIAGYIITILVCLIENYAKVKNTHQYCFNFRTFVVLNLVDTFLYSSLFFATYLIFISFS